MKARFGFDKALIALKEGKLVERDGWNGKGMFVALQPGYPSGVAANENTARVLRIPIGTTVVVRPYLVLMGADNLLATWVPSSTDVLAEDWTISDRTFQ